MSVYLLLVLLVVFVAAMIKLRQDQMRREQEEEKQTARLRALRKPPVPFVSASLRGSTQHDPDAAAKVQGRR